MASATLTLSQSPTLSPLPKLQAPSVETFSFKAPLLPASSTVTTASSSKQRRVSLATTSSPKLVPSSAWTFRDDTVLEEKKGKLRKITVDGEEELHERKLRKKWTPEETQMLVDGCNKHGVGNWKTILSDPTLKFDNRSPVDLKDRFRTYFPDAYKQHYPNARTHLSTKIRSTLPDGSSLFEKTRSKKRRPFTEEEDRALKAGYEKHGTIWATIVKDPVFQEQNRRSTDLRDRFRNAFPELYQAAGYKPRTAVKKKTKPIRAATDDQLAMSTTGPVRMQTRRRRRNTSQGIFRGGTKSVPQSNAPSEDEMSSGGEDDEDAVKPTRVMRSVSSSSNPLGWGHKPLSSFSSFTSSPVTSSATATDDEIEVTDMMDTSLGEYNYNNFAVPQNSNSSANSGNGNGNGNGMTMIGKSAWGTQDWFSPNPRLDSGTDNVTSGDIASSSSFTEGGGGNLSPSSPFSTFSSPPENNGHGVLDRYDLVPPNTSNPYHSFSHSHTSSSYTPYENLSFSSEIGAPGGRGFTHHSDYAGDLIFSARTHQPVQPFAHQGGLGLGLSGMTMPEISQSSGIHPLQLHTHTAALSLPGIDEIELTGITLEDSVMSESSPDLEVGIMDLSSSPPSGDLVDLNMRDTDDEPESNNDAPSDDEEEHLTPPATPLTRRKPLRGLRKSARKSSGIGGQYASTTAHGRSLSVPPVDRVGFERSELPPVPHANSQPDMIGQSSTSSNYRMDSTSGSTPAAAAQIPLPNPPTFASLFLAAQGENLYNLPFLDLHYYGGNQSNGIGMGGGGLALPVIDASENGSSRQALDLAQSTRSSLSRSHANSQPSQTLAGRHQRGQSTASVLSLSSSVCPQDLMLKRDNSSEKSETNKRKRASWDGGNV
ncbi:hypothetical protein EV360DRAFT_52294 [Lentinula raphanica]|nr:hypothetical protein EV360DRAFT_52294 [Lentinula raphanica]